jgi:DNA-binding transcriptional LysR family regulator
MHAMHMGDLNVTQIRLIAELLRLRSVSAASDSIGLSQSAASHALAKLRAQFDDPLFIRTPKGFQPTPYGERLGIAAQEAVAVLVAGITAGRKFDPRTTTRCFNLYASDVGQMVFLPKLLGYLGKVAPGASARVWPIPLEKPGLPLSSGDVDVAVGYFDNLTTGFRQSFLFRDRYVCVVRAAHPKFTKGMTVEAFQNAEHAIAHSTGMAHANIDQLLAKYQVRRKVALSVPGFHVLPMLITNSDLVAIVPGMLAEAYASHVHIKVLAMPVPPSGTAALLELAAKHATSALAVEVPGLDELAARKGSTRIVTEAQRLRRALGVAAP